MLLIRGKIDSRSPVIEVFYRDKYWPLVPGLRGSLSWFGGPLECDVETAVPLDEAVLHNFGSLNLAKFGIGGLRYFKLPLIYGICHEGCEISYEMRAARLLRITRIDAEAASEDFPYHGFPVLLPFYQLGLGEVEEYDFAKLNERLANIGWKLNKDALYAVVRQHPGIGVALFPPSIAEDSEIVFEFVPKSGVTRAVGQCA